MEPLQKAFTNTHLKLRKISLGKIPLRKKNKEKTKVIYKCTNMVNVI
jgi:hypothetical protein